MSGKPKIHELKTLDKVVARIREDLNNHNYVLLFAYNGTGKTRLAVSTMKCSTLRSGDFSLEDLLRGLESQNRSRSIIQTLRNLVKIFLRISG